MARCLLIESQLLKEMWTYAVHVVAYMHNNCFCQRTGKAPYEKGWKSWREIVEKDCRARGL